MGTETTTNNGTPAAPAAAMVPATVDNEGAIAAFASSANFESAQRMAKALAASTLVPEAYRNNIPNVLIAMELASRVGASVFMVMQNLDVIHGRPSWRALFLIATVNASGRFSPLRFRWQGKEHTDEWGCRAVAKDRSSGEECIGPLITLGLAKAEGWYQKSGSKWKTLPELMCSYRSAAFWTRLFAPELSLGMQTDQEIIDTTGVEVPDAPAALVPGSSKALEATLMAEPEPEPVPVPASAAVYHDPVTGEVVEPGKS